jgi:hypothetical protein
VTPWPSTPAKYGLPAASVRTGLPSSGTAQPPASPASTTESWPRAIPCTRFVTAPNIIGGPPLREPRKTVVVIGSVNSVQKKSVSV